MNTTTDTTTARQALASIGIDNPEQLTASGGSGWDFDRPATIAPAWTADTGSLQVHCGGECLFRIDWVGTYMRPAYVVRDDEPGSQWDSLRRRGVAPHEMGEHGLTHYRPHARIRIVQAG